jgi:hypothetical protein
MTEEQINQRASEIYPNSPGYKPEYIREQENFDQSLRREGYIKALREIEELPKIKGWVTRDKAGYGNSIGWLRLHFRKPEKTIRDWDSKDEFDVDDSQILKDSMFPELTYKDEPIEVELLIRKT